MFVLTLVTPWGYEVPQNEGPESSAGYQEEGTQVKAARDIECGCSLVKANTPATLIMDMTLTQWRASMKIEGLSCKSSCSVGQHSANPSAQDSLHSARLT